MIADSNSPSPIDYTDALFRSGLFIRANILDRSSGTPVQVATVDLIEYTNGLYQGVFQFTAGKPYLIQKLVYTDGTYSALDTDFAPSTDDIQCVNLQSGGGGGGGGTQIIIQSNTNLIATVRGLNLILNIQQTFMLQGVITLQQNIATC
jgi:hypothetical protein